MNTELLKRLPLGTSSFEALRESDEIYVDKTSYIYRLASNRGKYFLARPRRFGKSLLISAFESLFKHGLRDFKGLEIEKLWKDEKNYRVVRLDFARVKPEGTFKEFQEYFDDYLDTQFQKIGFKKSGSNFFTNQLEAFLDGLPASSLVLLIDEYDTPLTECLDDPKLFLQVRNYLSKFYSILKSNDTALRFFFITGITKFSKTNIFSALNNLTDISLSTEYGSLLGYTHKEVEEYFSKYLSCASETLKVEREELLNQLTAHYDGFCFEENAKQKVFAPWSLLHFFSSPERGLKDYWFESGGKPSVLAKYLQSHTLRDPMYYGKEKALALNILSGSSDVENLSDVGLLTQAGYLTIKRIQGTTAYVDYPNLEVRTAMAQLYLEQMLRGRTVEQIGAGNIAYLLANENAESVYHNLNHFLRGIDYRAYKDFKESSIQSFIQIYCAGAGLRARTEVHNNKGRSDLEVRSGFRHWVFEFKLVKDGESPEKKLREAEIQMKERSYGLSEAHLEIKRMALVFSLKDREFVKWAEIL